MKHSYVSHFAANRVFRKGKFIYISIILTGVGEDAQQGRDPNDFGGGAKGYFAPCRPSPTLFTLFGLFVIFSTIKMSFVVIADPFIPQKTLICSSGNHNRLRMLEMTSSVSNVSGGAYP